MRYALFAGEWCHRKGGWDDVQCVAEDPAILRKHCEEDMDLDDGWAHIVDLKEWIKVSEGRRDLAKHPRSWEWEEIYNE